MFDVSFLLTSAVLCSLTNTNGFTLEFKLHASNKGLAHCKNVSAILSLPQRRKSRKVSHILATLTELTVTQITDKHISRPF